MVPQWIIEKKRDGGELTTEEIEFFVDGFTRGGIPDYQMSALAMAVFFRGMTPAETAALTLAMMRSGDVVDTSVIPRPKVDKHSTGGIGDKTSLILAPLLACCDVAVPMISGRGLGITGGTLDKMESIPGYRAVLDENEFVAVVAEVGCAIVGQTERLVPADRLLYALRDVTATVPSIPLITASIMSKKLAEGIDHLVMDVKFGRGAFMRTRDNARRLAESIARVGREMGKGVRALLTDMNRPLGRAAGNALEVRECWDILGGGGSADLRDLTIELSAEGLVLAKRAAGLDEARTMLRNVLESGAARRKFIEMVIRQGGDATAIERPGGLPTAAVAIEVPAPRAGWVADVDAEKIGRACILLGAGRRRTEDRVDHAVGVDGMAEAGERVEAGQPLAVVHVNDRANEAEALELVRTAFSVGESPVEAPPRVVDRI